MCDAIAIAAAGVAVSAGSAAAQYSQAQSAAKKQASYNAAVEAQQSAYRVQVMQYQNEVWAQDLKYSGDLLAWAEQEWDRQVRWNEGARKAIEKNTIQAISTILLRQVEEDMATIAQGFEVRRQGAQARARVAAQDRGVEGNSVDAILEDVMRQEGEVLTTMALNRSALARQLNREAIAADAQGDQQLASLQLKTYAPQAPIRTPSPVSPVNPAPPVVGPSGVIPADVSRAGAC